MFVMVLAGWEGGGNMTHFLIFVVVYCGYGSSPHPLHRSPCPPPSPSSPSLPPPLFHSLSSLPSVSRPVHFPIFSVTRSPSYSCGCFTGALSFFIGFLGGHVVGYEEVPLGAGGREEGGQLYLLKQPPESVACVCPHEEPPQCITHTDIGYCWCRTEVLAGEDLRWLVRLSSDKAVPGGRAVAVQLL